MIIHIDMDAFYASVEQLDNPDLRGKCVIVGGSPTGRGVVAAASYEARAFGVRSAMPAAKALRLCPEGIIIRPRMSRYREVSHQIRNVFHAFTPQVEPLSLDEAFLDATGSEQLFGDSVSIGKQIKQRIKEELGLTASVGVAPNKFLAKLASDIEKPDGFVVITEEQKLDFIGDLPVRRIWGVGPVAEERLAQMGVRTIGQIRALPIKTLKARFGKMAEQLYNLARGIDDRKVTPHQETKSISNEVTFDKDVFDSGELERTLHALGDEVGTRLRKSGLRARTVTLKLRYASFKTITRSATLARSFNRTDIICLESVGLLHKVTGIKTLGIRLVGVGVSNLSERRAVQLSLFGDEDDTKHEQLDKVVDGIREKMGADAMQRASALPSDSIETLLRRLARSKFRSKFKLSESDRAYTVDKGMDTIREYASDFIRQLKYSPLSRQKF